MRLSIKSLGLVACDQHMQVALQVRSPRDASLRSTRGPACSVVTGPQHRLYGYQSARGSIANRQSRVEADLELKQIDYRFDSVPFLLFMTVAHLRVRNTY